MPPSLSILHHAELHVELLTKMSEGDPWRAFELACDAYLQLCRVFEDYSKIAEAAVATDQVRRAPTAADEIKAIQAVLNDGQKS